jgi:uncharacterized protein (TIGR03000 family)
MFRAFRSVPRAPAAAVAALLLGAAASAAEPPSWGTKLWPWNVQGYQGYNEPRAPATPTAPTNYAAPRKYTLAVSQLPRDASEGDPNAVVLMAHVPEDALIWFDNKPTQKRGMLRYFESPALTPGVNYSYEVRVGWVEEGRWVSETNRLRVRAGEMHCIDIVRADATAEQEKERAALARLDPEDRKLAEAQKFCAVQTDKRLGSMGTPVKVQIEGEPVFLCCEGCVKKAQGNPEQTLKVVREMKARNSTAPDR